MPTLLRACFEDNSLSLFPDSSGAVVAATTGLSLRGEYCLACLGASDYAQRTIAEGAVNFAAMRIRIPTLDSSTGEIQIAGYFHDSDLLCNLAVDGDGYLLVYNGESTLLATSDYPIVEDTSYLLEFYFSPSPNPLGRFQVKVNNITAINFTGNTKTGTVLSFTAFRAGYCGVVGRIAGAYYDNIILSDSAWIGDTELQLLEVTEAGSISETQSDGGSVYTFLHEEMTGNILQVKGIQVQAAAYNQDSSFHSSFDLVLNPITDSSEEVAYGGDNFVLEGSPQVFVHNWDSHPNFLTPFTEADINGTEIGYSEEDIS